MPKPLERIVVSKFKATCLRLFARINRTGQPILVTKRGKPIALVSPPPTFEARKEGFGIMAGTGEIMGDILEPLPESDWEVLRD
jgi:antitoxin (DNA-binding transcriptional repressor) of toxin-antitoxin stability system